MFIMSGKRQWDDHPRTALDFNGFSLINGRPVLRTRKVNYCERLKQWLCCAVKYKVAKSTVLLFDNAKVKSEYLCGCQGRNG